MSTQQDLLIEANKHAWTVCSNLQKQVNILIGALNEIAWGHNAQAKIAREAIAFWETFKETYDEDQETK